MLTCLLLTFVEVELNYLFIWEESWSNFCTHPKDFFLPLRFLSEQKFSSLSLIETLSVCVMLLVIFSANTCFGWQRLFAFLQHLKKVKFRLKSGEKLIFQWNTFLSQRILEAKRKEKDFFPKIPIILKNTLRLEKYFRLMSVKELLTMHSNQSCPSNSNPS